MDSMSDEFAARLASVVLKIEDNIVALARKLQADGTNRLVSDQAAIGRAVALRTDLARAMRNGGYGELIDDAIDEPFMDLANEVMHSSSIAAKAAELTATDERALRVIQDQRASELLGIANDAATVISNVILNGVVGAQPKDDLIDSLSEALGNSFEQAHTVYDTAVTIWARQVDQIKATGAPDELFIYMGPVDQKVRPFCREYVGKVLTREDIDQLDNEQLPNVLLTGGGYNCRHQWKRVTKFDDELRALAESGDRAPEVQADLDRVKAQEDAIQVAKDRAAQEKNRARLDLAPALPFGRVPGEGATTAARLDAEAALQARILNRRAALEQGQANAADLAFAAGVRERDIARAAERARLAALPPNIPGDVNQLPAAARGEGIQAVFGNILTGSGTPIGDSGFTYNMVTGEQPTSGFAVSPYKQFETKVKLAGASHDEIVNAFQDFFVEHLDLLQHDGNFLGGWVNPADGYLYLDVSTVLDNQLVAEDLARANDQIAYFNLGKGEAVVVPQITERGGRIIPGLEPPPEIKAAADEARRAVEGTNPTAPGVTGSFAIPDVKVETSKVLGDENTGNANVSLNITASKIGNEVFDPPIRLVFKPGEGENFSVREDIKNDNAPLWQREIMAARVNAALGTELMKPVFGGAVPGQGEGMLMGWVDGKRGTVDTPDEATRMTVLDLILGNTDRHGGNLMRGKDGKLYAIDHGFAFPEGSQAGPSNYQGMTKDNDFAEMGLNEFRSVAAEAIKRGMDIPAPLAKTLADQIDKVNWNGMFQGSNFNTEEIEAFLLRTAFVSEHLKDGTLASIIRRSYKHW